MLKARLSREIAALLCAKFFLLAGLYYAFFSPSHRITVDSRAAAMRILGSGKHP
ncbi:MAG: cytochrome oxidase putative small subunit CydP [Rhizomicrobium sp.]